MLIMAGNSGGFTHGAPWNPSKLFLSDELGGRYDPSDLSTMFKDADQLIPVAVDGDVVRVMLDKSGNGFDVTALPGKGPIYRTDGVKHWLSFNGVDQELGCIHGETIGDFLVCGAGREEGRVNGAFYGAGVPIISPYENMLSAIVPWSDGNYYFDTDNLADGRITGVWPKSVGDDVVISHVRSGTAIEAFEGSSSLGTLTNGGSITPPNTAIYLGSAGGVNYYKGRLYGLVMVFDSKTDLDRANLETYMADKAGV